MRSQSYVTSYNLEYPNSLLNWCHGTFLVEPAIHITVIDIVVELRRPPTMAYILEQEVVESLGQAMTARSHMSPRKWRDQKAWHMIIHGSLTRITSKETVDRARMPALGHIVPFNLKYDHELPSLSNQSRRYLSCLFGQAPNIQAILNAKLRNVNKGIIPAHEIRQIRRQNTEHGESWVVIRTAYEPRGCFEGRLSRWSTGPYIHNFEQQAPKLMQCSSYNIHKYDKQEACLLVGVYKQLPVWPSLV